MKRWIAFFVLATYFTLQGAESVHAHASHQQTPSSCGFCQIVQTNPVISTGSSIVPVSVHSHAVITRITHTTPDAFFSQATGRSPPAN